jgi:hypothetical protein
MEGASAIETKKAVCRTFVNVVKASPLAEAIDPKTFLMMLNSHFSVLYQGGTLHLAPIWDALAAAHAPESLFGLFLRFEQVSGELGIPVVLPRELAELSPETRQIHLLRFTTPGPATDPSGFTPLMELEPVPGMAPPALLSTADLKPVVPDETRRKVNVAVVQSIKSTPVGAKLDASQLAFLVDSNFDQLCDGTRFDFEGIHAAMREVPGVTDTDVYVAAVRLAEQLKVLGIQMELPVLQVKEAEVKALLAAPRRTSGVSDPRMSPPPAVTPKDGAKADAGGEKHARGKERLRSLGLGGADTQQTKLIRFATLAVLVVAAGGFAWLNRPSRDLDPGDYGDVIPLKEARLDSGVFQGELDMKAWKKLKYKQREQSVHAFEDRLREDGFIPNMQVRDDQNRIVIVAASGGKISAARVLLENDLPAGDQAPQRDEKKAPEKSAPPPDTKTATTAQTPPGSSATNP